MKIHGLSGSGQPNQASAFRKYLESKIMSMDKSWAGEIGQKGEILQKEQFLSGEQEKRAQDNSQSISKNIIRQ
jgi:hypothetical protein